MEAVKQFNSELSSLYEIKPPISKAKMTSITKGAIRSIKYYKHVVQVCSQTQFISLLLDETYGLSKRYWKKLKKSIYLHILHCTPAESMIFCPDICQQREKIVLVVIPDVIRRVLRSSSRSAETSTRSLGFT